MPGRGKHILAIGLAILATIAGRPARADDASPAPPAAPAPPPPARSADPEKIAGIARRAIEPGDPQREALAAMLFIPRKTVELLFLATGTAAGLMRDEQVVPRIEELLSPRPGEISIFPNLILDTRRAPSVGVRMIGRGNNAATSISLAFGGAHDLLAESRVRLGSPWPVPFVFSAEALADSRSRLDYLGLGQDPEADPRNRFRRSALTHEALYFERRERVTGSLGARVANDVEIFASSSYTRSRVEDPPDGGLRKMSAVFLSGSVPGAPGESRVVYTELALRLDTRPTLGRPSSGYLIEGYGGIGKGVAGDGTSFFRAGGRGALFIPLLRRANILSPKVVVDGLVQPKGVFVPFTELVSQPEFRGFDTRRDNLSVVASVDYRWAMIRYLGARLFVDVATVAPNVESLLAEPPRFAAGFGIDLYSKSTELGQFAMSFSPEGVRLLLTFGVPSSFGDRQHRY